MTHPSSDFRSAPGPTLALVARTTQVRLAARDGAGAHIEVLERAAGDGVWLPDTAARSLGVAAGQTVRLGGPPSVPLRVAGVYRDLAPGSRPLDPFWSPLSSVIHTLSAARDTPPPLLLVDPDRFLELSTHLDTASRLEWDLYPEPGRLTLPRADLLVVRRAHATLAALTGPVESISLTGRLLALVVVAAAGAFAVRRRRGEVLVLSAQGVGGLPLGLRSMAQAALPLA